MTVRPEQPSDHGWMRRAGSDGGFVAPSPRIPPAAFQYLPLTSYDPSMTGTLVYPDVFWEHDAVGLRD